MQGGATWPGELPVEIEGFIPETVEMLHELDGTGLHERLGAKGGRPPGFDQETYKRRNVIERCFETFKQWRGIATRYDKLAVTYRDGIILRAITIWLKPLGDTP